MRLQKYSGYWFDIIFGGLLTLIILLGTGSLLLNKLVIGQWFPLYAAFCLLLVGFYQWSDDNLTSKKTGLSKTDNLALVTKSLGRLRWHYRKSGGGSIDLTLNKYFLKFLDPTIMVEEGNILFNFKYHSTTQTGRLPFFFGISMFLEYRFRKQLERVSKEIQINK